MKQPWALGPEVKRMATASGLIVYDASRASNFDASWFDPEYWRRRDAIRGAALGRGSTWLIDAHGLQLALRRYRRGGLAARISEDRYWFIGESSTRPMREWTLTYHLHRLGLPVPAPIAARYQRAGRTYTGELITARILEAESLAEQLAATSLPFSRWIAVGRCIRSFHDAGLDHVDLNAHNVLRRLDGRVFLIDFDRCRLRRRGLWCDANLVRLRRSLLKVTARLPEERFSETDWQSLLAGYWDRSA